jgi:SAM-dependent methyltransferase
LKAEPVQVDGYSFMADAVSKFHRSVYVSGWFRHDDDHLVDVSLVGTELLSQVGEIGLRHGSVEPNTTPGKGFRLQCLRNDDCFDDAMEIVFHTSSGRVVSTPLLDLATERAAQSATARLYHRYLAEVATMYRPLVIDLGGRARSGNERASDFPGARFVVADILGGPNVDVVADAHQLSRHVAPGSVDAVICVATFEHLAMPWKAVVEINRVLRSGGLACLISHHTIGLHDMPCDYWRFSADAWDALLNQQTGMEIVGRSLSDEQFIIPFFYQPEAAHAELSAGYTFSGVIARKVGSAMVDWDVPLGEVVAIPYPFE